MKVFFAFLSSLLIALAPQIYSDLKEYFGATNVDFYYTTSQNFSCQIIEKEVELRSYNKMIDDFYEEVQKSFDQDGYSKKIMLYTSVQKPLQIGSDFIAKIYKPLLRIYEMQNYGIFQVINNTGEDIGIQNIQIVTNDANEKPLWCESRTFMANEAIMQYTNNPKGYYVSFNKGELIIPQNKSYYLIISFKGEPFITEKNSFVALVTNNSKHKLISLKTKAQETKNSILFTFSLEVLLIFIFILFASLSYQPMKKYILNNPVKDKKE